MTTPEGKVKDAIKKVLKKHGAYYHMPVQNGMGEPTLDFVGCLSGWFIGIEAKTIGKKPTLRQEITIARMRAAGGNVFVVDGPESLAVLDATLYYLQSNPTKEQLEAHLALHEHEHDQLRPARKPKTGGGRGHPPVDDE